MMNSQVLGTPKGRDEVLNLLFKDGLTPEEALSYGHARSYAVELTNCPSRTAIAHVERHLRALDRSAHEGR